MLAFVSRMMPRFFSNPMQIFHRQLRLRQRPQQNSPAKNTNEKLFNSAKLTQGQQFDNWV